MDKEPVTLEELKELLTENIEATEENTRLLKAMRRDAVIGGVIKFVFWVALIIASFYFTAKFLEPYMATIMGAGQDGQEWMELLELYKSQMGQ